MTLPFPIFLEPRCSHFGDCGGCEQQDIPYETQLKKKQNFLMDLFQKEIDPILPCDDPWHYRNKMEFSFTQSLKGERFCGLMKRKGRGRVVSLETCFLANVWMMHVLKQIRKWWEDRNLTAYHPYKNAGSLRTLTLREGRRTNEKMALLTVSGNTCDALNEKDLQTLVETLLEACSFTSIIVRKQIAVKGSPTRMEERVLHGRDHIFEHLYNAQQRMIRFKIRAASFFQPNSLQAEKLYQKVIEIAEIKNNHTLLDLYCGTGSLGMFAAPAAAHVTGIELISEAVRDARDNLQLNQIDNMEVIEGDVQDILDKHTQKPDIILIDPPRAGLTPKALQHIKRLSAKTVIYVSCNPRTQVENCKELFQEGYQLIHLQGVDQFPHTSHVETIACLKKMH